MSEIKKHYRSCNICEAMCGIIVETQGDKVLSIQGDSDDPFSKGYVCPKSFALQDIYEDPNRLKQPVKKTENGWEKISWDEAFNILIEKTSSIQEKYGNDSLGIYQGNPNSHSSGAMLYGASFFKQFKTKNHYSATSADQLPHHFASYFMFGHQLVTPIPDIDHTDYFIIMGGNPMASNGSLMSAAGFPNRLKALQKRGGKFIVIDPRMSETAVKADEHYFIKPGTDCYFLLAFLNQLFEKGKINLRHIEKKVKGLDKLPAIVKDYTPEKVESLTGIKANDIRKIVDDYTKSEKAVLYGRMGLSTQAFGAINLWLINVINIVSGNFDRQGGAMFTMPAADTVGILAMLGAVGHYNRFQSRLSKRPEFGGELPVSVLADEMLTPGDGQIKAMITASGNPVLSTPNGDRLAKGLEQLEFMACIDIYINETTQYADLIIPPTTGLTSDHYDLIFHNFAVSNTSRYSSAVFERKQDEKHDWEIYAELTERMLAHRGKQTKPHKFEVLRRLGHRDVMDLILRKGLYGFWGGKKMRGQDGLSVRRLIESKHGIFISPLFPCIDYRLFTADRLIDLVPEIYTTDLDRVAKNAQSHKNGLVLIGRRHLLTNNSWLHNSERMVKGRNRCTLIIHPEDAVKYKIENKEMVKVSSRTGEIKIEAEVSDKIMPGTVSIPHGWGHDKKGIKLDVASQHPGVSINDITDQTLVDELCGNAAFSGVPVEVAPL